MAETQQIVVEFIVDDSQLQPAIDKLEKSGQIDSKVANSFKQTNAELAKRLNLSGQISLSATREQTIYNKLVSSLKQLSGESKKAVESLLKMSTEEVAAGFDKAAISVDDYLDALNKAGNGAGGAEEATESLRTRLKNLSAQIAEVKLNGEQFEGQLESLAKEAGHIKEAIHNAGKEIENMASSHRVIENLIGSAQAVAGAFGIAQGATALFGEESEDLHKTLLKVTAGMEILEGLQAVGNALQKEGAITQLGNAIATKGAAAAQFLYNIVVGESIGLLKAFRIALAATGIGLLIFGVIELVSALKSMGESTKESIKELQKLNNEFDRDKEVLDNYVESVKQNGDEIIASLESRNASEKELRDQRLQNSRDELKATFETEELYRDEFNKRLQLLRDVANGQREFNKDEVEEAEKFVEKFKSLETKRVAIASQTRIIITENEKKAREEALKNQVASIEAQLLNAKEGSQRQLSLEKQLITASANLQLGTQAITEAEKTAIIVKAQKEREEKQIEFNKRQIDLQLKNIESQLVNVEEGSREEFNLKLKQLKLQSQSEIQSTKLSEAEKKTIREKGFQDQVKLLREFNERQRKEAIEGQISLNNVALNQLKTTEEEKLLLQIDNLSLSAALEIDAAKGNATKIKEINAKLNADILAARKKFLEDELTFALSLQQAREGAERRALERIVNNQKLSIATRKAAIEDLTRKEAEEIDKRLALLEEEKRKKLISEKDYQLQYAQLQDQKKQVTEKNEKDITELTKQENELRRQVITEAFNAIQEIFSGLNDQLTSQEEQRIAGQKAQVNALLEAGAITEKEAAARNKRIEADEKRVKREAAQRDKALAIFTAVINTAKAVTSALTAPPPFGQILAAIVGALGAAQIALIASKPIPKFRTGKKNQYEGRGKIGEAGAEIFEHDGKMYLANKETLVWVGKDDKVYTPTETKQMLPQVDHKVMNWKPEPKTVELIDYDRLGKAVGKNISIPGVSVDEEGFKVWQQEGNSRKNYMDKRYSSK